MNEVGRIFSTRSCTLCIVIARIVIRVYILLARVSGTRVRVEVQEFMASYPRHVHVTKRVFGRVSDEIFAR